MTEEKKNPSSVAKEIPKLHTVLPPALTFLTVIIVILIFWSLFSGRIMRFYASFVFFFYSLIKSMWLSVILLGIFQTIILIPLRIVNLRISLHVEEFEQKIEELEIGKKESGLPLLKEKIAEGNFTVLWYIVNFIIQASSYLSIGRLFLTDFYNFPLDPKLLYSFVPYPKYPIQDIYFKIPYPVFTKTLDLGMKYVWIFWLIVITLKFLYHFIILFYRHMRRKSKTMVSDTPQVSTVKKVIKYISSSSILFLFLGWLLIRHFPVAWQIRIFTGPVSHQNTTFNLITAIATFVIILWLDIPKISKKVRLAKEQKIPSVIIKATQKGLFKNSLKNAVFIGLGAFFITNQIPCAFELSIFVFEIISFFSPLTLDRLILRTQKIKPV